MSIAHRPGRRLPIPAAWPVRSSPAVHRCPGVPPCLLTVAGMAGLGIAASPEPASGATPRHLAWTVLGAVTIAVWPAFAARRASPRPLILSVCGSAAVPSRLGDDARAGVTAIIVSERFGFSSPPSRPARPAGRAGRSRRGTRHRR